MCEGVKLTTLDQFDSDEDKRAILYILRSVYNSFVQLVLPLVLRERPFFFIYFFFCLFHVCNNVVYVSVENYVLCTRLK